MILSKSKSSNSNRDDLCEFIVKTADTKKIDKEIFVKAVLCYHDFIKKCGYKLVYDRTNS